MTFLKSTSNIVTILVILMTSVPELGCNPDRAAIKLRDERLTYLNSLKRKYIPEGVYISKRNISQLEIEKDKFGNEVYLTKDLGKVEYEVSFTGEKLVILNSKANIEEEIKFSEYITITEISDKSTSYAFPIVSWKIRNHKSGSVISDILVNFNSMGEQDNENEPRVILSIREGENPTLQLWHCFRIGGFDRTYIKPIKKSFAESIESIKNCYPFIVLQELRYPYSEVFGPVFVGSAKYEDNEYDLDNYRK